jgi:hypothetical protein
MRLREITRILAASVLLVVAANGSTKTAARGFRSHLIAPASARQVVEGSLLYEPPRSPGYNDLTAS